MKKRIMPEISGGAMADIAFMLLIFFLVATTLDADWGLMRKLPPNNDGGTEIVDVRNVFTILLNNNNKLMVQQKELDPAKLKERVREFIVNREDKPDMPIKITRELPWFGQTKISQAVISLQNDRNSRYGDYIFIQNQLVAAYNELRNELAEQKFGQAFDDLPAGKQNVIKKIYPMRISEAEPKHISDKP